MQSILTNIQLATTELTTEGTSNGWPPCTLGAQSNGDIALAMAENFGQFTLVCRNACAGVMHEATLTLNRAPFPSDVFRLVKATVWSKFLYDEA